MSDTTAGEALRHWNIKAAEIHLIAQRENKVYQVTSTDGIKHALRIHRPGYQSIRAIQSELLWMTHLKSTNLDVPIPLPTSKGDLVIHCKGHHCDLLSWLNGLPIGSSAEPLSMPDRLQTLKEIGDVMARLHIESDRWQASPTFERPAWDSDGLLGDNALWGRFWENPGLTSGHQELLLNTREQIIETLKYQSLDYGLIHADLVPENILVSQTGIQLIDFDDSGFGYRLFDIATTLFKYRNEPDYRQLEHALLAGYRSNRPIDTTTLPLCILLRSLTYVGWIIPRMDEPGADIRQHRFISNAIELAEAFTATAPGHVKRAT